MAAVTALALVENSFPSICIPFSKMHYGAFNQSRVDEAFVKKCFSRYGSVSRVVLKSHFTEIPHFSSSDAAAPLPVETYYSIVIHFHSWDMENREAMYVRSVLMLPDEYSNVKLVYDSPWYWKFFAFKQKYHGPYHPSATTALDKTRHDKTRQNATRQDNRV
jgi:hypothetical protein